MNGSSTHGGRSGRWMVHRSSSSDPSLRYLKHGPIRPMVEDESFLRRLLDWLR